MLMRLMGNSRNAVAYSWVMSSGLTSMVISASDMMWKQWQSASKIMRISSMLSLEGVPPPRYTEEILALADFFAKSLHVAVSDFICRNSGIKRAIVATALAKRYVYVNAGHLWVAF